MKYSREFKEKYIEAYLKTFSVIKTIRLFGLDRQTHYNWLKKDKWFKEEFEKAKRNGIDQLIEESENIHRIIRLGIPKKNKEGELIGWKTPPDARANEWFLTKRSPDYNDLLKIEHGADETFADVIKNILTNETTPETTKGDKPNNTSNTGD